MSTRSFVAELLANQLVPSLCHCMGLVCPTYKTSYLSLLNFMRFLMPCLGPSVEAQLFSKSIESLSLVTFADLKRVYSTSSARSVIKIPIKVRRPDRPLRIFSCNQLPATVQSVNSYPLSLTIH